MLRKYFLIKIKVSLPAGSLSMQNYCHAQYADRTLNSDMVDFLCEKKEGFYKFCMRALSGVLCCFN